jgi:uncharacterized protein (TIGR03118 family)
VAVALAAGAAAAAPAATASARHASDHARHGYRQINLVADRPGRAKITDPNLVNAWGISHGPNTPLWVSDNGTNVSTLYQGGAHGTPPSIVPLVVRIPGGAPTGQVFNDTHRFKVPGTGASALFIFAGEHGDLSAWNQAVPTPTKAVHITHVRHAVYKGLALVHSPFGALLLAANFRSGRVDVFNGRFKRLHTRHLFSDPRIPKGYAPFNVATIGHRVFVSYAKQDSARMDDVAGRGHGFIDVFTNYGTLRHRFASRGVLNSPWGMTIAPTGFGRFSNDLLVGNFGNGRIHVFNPRTGKLLGALRDRHHRPIVIDGLWGLLPGDQAAGGTHSVWFSAGPNDESHGLLGLLRAG